MGTRIFSCRFPAVAERLAPVRAQLRSWLAERPIERDREQALLLAVGEACSNAVEHAYLGRPPGEIDLHVRHGAEGFTVRVRDRGTWRGEHGDDRRGRGSGIMRALSDEFRRETDDTGTTVTFRIRVPRLCEP